MMQWTGGYCGKVLIIYGDWGKSFGSCEDSLLSAEGQLENREKKAIIFVSFIIILKLRHVV